MRDVVASALVGLALIVYGAWVIGIAIPGLSEPWAVALAVLVLGMGASMSAVVPAFGELISGSRIYLATASALGVVALAGGMWAWFANEPLGLALLVPATLILWAMSTTRHLAAGGTVTA